MSDARSSRRYATRSLDSLPDPRASSEQLRREFANNAKSACNSFRAQHARGGRRASSIERMRREVFDPEALTKSRAAATAELSPPAAAAGGAQPPPPPVARACLLYTSPSPRDGLLSRMPSSA